VTIWLCFCTSSGGLEGGRDAVISVRTRDVCGVVVYSLMMRLVEEGLARRHKQGVYLIERGL
jgi:hypothetical protein